MYIRVCPFPTCVVELAAVVRGAEDRDELTLGEELVAVLFVRIIVYGLYVLIDLFA